MRVLFMGTPDFALEVLKAVYAKDGVEVIGAVTQTDKPKGRGMKMIAPPVKVFAEEHDIPVFQPTTLKDGAFENELKALDPELIVVAAYGKILPHYVIAYPKYGCVNAHASLLPRWRGAAPINRAIMAGDTVTGVTAMYMDDGLDTGDKILTVEVPIGDDDNVGVIHDKLAEAGGKAICGVIDMIVSGSVTRTPQESDGVTYAEKITKEDCRLDFSLPCREVYNKIRGLAPVPCAVTTTADGKLLKITGAKMTDKVANALPGTVISTDGGVIEVALCDGTIRIDGVIPEGKSRMSAADYIRGRKIAVCDVLGK
ncbi:MAG: methionyl-tRNA formyltransferase [Clostridia bacterium]|nr:methionyl-tRNA formyltransferase [Clostridia bacterium]